jgi:Zn-dependent metalloprotease
MRKMLNLAIVLLLALAPVALAADQPIDWSAQSARIFSGSEGQALTARSNAAPEMVVRNFLGQQNQFDKADNGLTLRAQGAGMSGQTVLRFKQQVAGLEVYGTYAKAVVSESGQLIHLIENLAVVPTEGVWSARISEQDALGRALALHHPNLKALPVAASSDLNQVTFNRGKYFYSAPTVTRVAVPMLSGRMEEGFLVETWSLRANQLHYTLVGAKGRILHVENRTNSDTYKIFADHPGNSNQTVVSGPGTGNTESPSGWVFSNTTTGNNVDAYLDRDNNGSSDGRPVSASQTFEYTANLSQAPTTAVNQDVAVANLFYLNNVIHDSLYRHGFNESAGNFQENNFGNGGNGSDSVNAEAQDGGSTNNANFSTPNDGSNPRMQMYLWTQSNPGRDGDLDSDIVWHEYGHGLTWRMIGNMSGPLSGAIGEGMSDVLAIYTNRDDVVGEYSFNDAGGIRRFPYGSHPLTYGDVAGSSVHADGEIYAATMWDLLGLWEGAGYTLDELFDVVVGGMNSTPSGPAYEDMRDGLLAASPTQAKDCVIWEAFAARGIGEGADGRTRGNRVTITESFTLPAACSSCTVTENPEVSCGDGVDNDCDGQIDSADSDCGGGSCTMTGQSCSNDVDCCSLNCSNGKPSTRVCQ